MTLQLHYVTLQLHYVHISLNITFLLSCKVVKQISGNRPLLLTLLHVTVKFDLRPPTRIYGFF